MPSPFPGMDPYLEGDEWTGFHNELAIEVKRQLAPKLQPRYYPFTVRYFLAESPEEVSISSQAMYPDVGVVKASSGSLPSGSAAPSSAPVRMLLPMPTEVPHVRVEIRDRKNRKLVTLIEFLSPTNKSGGGRKAYLRKRRRVLNSDVHLVEIDLLRKGRRAPMNTPYPPGDYFVLVSRAEDRPETDVWPVRLDESLPRDIPIPLLEGDPEVPLDLQKAVQDAYVLGTFDSAIDYLEPPDAPLTREQDEWADRLLRAAGLRT
jgi:Protein of unknown function (DUF4058)